MKFYNILQMENLLIIKKLKTHAKGLIYKADEI